MTVKELIFNEETIEIVFTIDEARYLFKHFEKMEDKDELQYKIYAKMHDGYTHHEFQMWKKNKQKTKEVA